MANVPQSVVRIVSALTASAVLVSGCSLGSTGIGGVGAPAPEPTIAAKTSTSQSRPEAKVRKGTIQDSIKVIGRVISSQEADLYFRTTNRLRGIFVETGQEVKAGQLMAEQETGDLITRIGKAQATLENAQINLDKAKAKGVLDETSDEISGVDTAQINLDQAALQLEKLKQGALDSDVKAAEASLAQSVANVEKSRVDLASKEAQLAARRADLDTKLAGPLPDALAGAQAEVETRRVALEKINAGTRSEDIQTSEIKLEQARTKLSQVRDAPPVKAEDLANAELAVRAAEIKLDQARAITAGSVAQREADTRTAELNVEIARNKLESLKNQQINNWDVRLAEQSVAAAENDLAKLKSGPNQFDQRSAKVAYDLAVTKLEMLRSGATEVEINTLKTEINSIQLSLESARLAIPSAEIGPCGGAGQAGKRDARSHRIRHPRSAEQSRKGADRS